MSNAQMEARLVIRGQDETGATFKAIEKHMNDVGKSFKGMNDVARNMSVLGGTGWETLKRDMSVLGGQWKEVGVNISRAGSSIDRVGNSVSRATQMMRGFGEAAKTAAGFVGAAAGFEAAHEIGKGIHSGAEYEDAKARAAVAGIKPADLEAVDQASLGLIAKYPNISRAEAIDTYKELRSVLRKPEEALPSLEDIVAAKSAMRAGGQGNPEDLIYVLRGGDVLGKANDPAELRQYIDSGIKAMQVMGKTVKPEDFFEVAKMAKTSGLLLSDRFLNTTAISLMQDLGGAQAGSAFNAANAILTGRGLNNNHAAVLEWMKLGALTKEDVAITQRTGQIHGLKPGHGIKHGALGRSDPDIFLYQHLLPAMEHFGYRDLDSQITELNRLFPGSRAADLFAKILVQREAFANHARLYAEAQGIDGGLALLQKSPTAALGALGTSIESVIGTAAAPIMEKFTPAIERAAESLGRFSGVVDQFMKDHPIAGPAAVGGVAVAGLGATALAGRALWNMAFGGGKEAAAAAAEAASGPGLLAGAMGAAGWLGRAALSPPAIGLGAYFGSTTGLNQGEDERARQLSHALPYEGINPSGLNLLGHGPVTARLEGQALISVQLDLNASDELRRLMQIGARSSVQSTGDLGLSMPEATPDAGGRFNSGGGTQ
ncbi:MAG TPA: hypothetical protein VME69_12170 [Methylocella sp.]|nr:hypothetical protein [Methylocella sp.]